MIDLTTNYLGLHLRNPIVASPSPLCERLDNIRKMEDVGAGAVVLHSLFEEQIEIEGRHLDQGLFAGTDSYSEALSYFPDLQNYNLGPDGYLEHLRRAKESVEIPIIASLNGITTGGWVDFAHKIEQAGADALELNIYDLPVNPQVSGASLERTYLELVAAVRAGVRIPLAVKLHPFFTSMSHMARGFEEAGANALVLFNRFYQPDFDLHSLEVTPRIVLSSQEELLLRLHWVAILFGHVGTDLAITGGVHMGEDIIKSMMAGARVAMMTSALLKHGIQYIARVLKDVVIWMEDHEYESIRQMQGSMSRISAGNPPAFERSNYMRVISSYDLRERIS